MNGRNCFQHNSDTVASVRVIICFYRLQFCRIEIRGIKKIKQKKSSSVTEKKKTYDITLTGLRRRVAKSLRGRDFCARFNGYDKPKFPTPGVTHFGNDFRVHGTDVMYVMKRLVNDVASEILQKLP